LFFFFMCVWFLSVQHRYCFYLRKKRCARYIPVVKCYATPWSYISTPQCFFFFLPCFIHFFFILIIQTRLRQSYNHITPNHHFTQIIIKTNTTMATRGYFTWIISKSSHLEKFSHCLIYTRTLSTISIFYDA